MKGKYWSDFRQEQWQLSIDTLSLGSVFLRLLTTLFFILIAASLFGQYPGSSRGSQGNNFGGNRSGARGSTGESFAKDPSRDTLNKDVFIYYADNAEKKEQFQDSSMLNFHIYDPVRQAEYEYVHLGNLGSAHRQIVYQPRFHKGFDAGFHNYDLYKTKPEDIPYYNLEKVYSDIYFSQANQERTSFNANLGKPVGKRADMGIYYKNIRNLGQYTNQDARANAFSATFNYQSKNQKYRSFFSATTNTIQQKENGGGNLDDPNFAKRVIRGGQRVTTIPAGRPVNTETGESRYFERDYNYTQFYILQKTPKTKIPEPTREDSLRALVTAVKDTIPDSLKTESLEMPEPVTIEDSLKALEPTITDTIPDTIKSNSAEIQPTKGTPKNPSIGNKGRPNGPKNPQRPRQGPPPPQAVVPQLPTTGRKFTLKHNLSIRKNTYKYSDIDTTAYLSDFIQDDRGVRSFIQTNQIENTFSLRTFKLAKENEASVYGANVAEKIDQKDLIEAGITHTYTDLTQEPFNSKINTLFLFGKMQFTPSERLKINTYAHLGLGIQANDDKILNHTGDYYLKGDFFWDTKKLGKIDLSVIHQNYEPSLIQQRFLSTQTPIWVNNYAKINETSLSAKYAIPKLKIDLAANYHLIKNYIYYDTLASPIQFDGDLNILQLVAKNQIDVWRFHLQNTVYFQTELSDNNIIRFPKIYGINRLYMDLKLFKVMKSQLGGEVRWNMPYKPDNFQPLTAQFFQQETEVGFYPIIDVFFNFRIQQFRFFIVGENLWHFNPNAELHFNTYTYAIPDFQMRFGFRWLFLD